MRYAVFCGAALALVGAAGVIAGGGLGNRPVHAAGNAAEVTIEDFRFAPTALSVTAGTRVTWVNKDFEPHTVVSAGDSAAFKSAGLDTDDKFSVVFDKAGTFKYFCSVHPRMTGVVTVQ